MPRPQERAALAILRAHRQRKEIMAVTVQRVTLVVVAVVRGRQEELLLDQMAVMAATAQLLQSQAHLLFTQAAVVAAHLIMQLDLWAALAEVAMAFYKQLEVTVLQTLAVEAAVLVV